MRGTAFVENLAVEPKQVVVIRTWKRDGSRNTMLLDTAIQNLLRSMIGDRAMIADRLLAGEVLHTSHATFSRA
jgi:hypothetical protein